ncbi:hypothetical protein FF36_02247 [Frankia torreyi]|uniref:DUF305 domain-containing protein n=2 Tax=Frankia TaxID=1854 RepID=A0A0D8BHC3_9ACTN|nr:MULTISPECIES: DUF305 domain-containing protein [Frankia]KJE23541.1 hypothetical protein FF36_02247 [Frankia torreyi]KQC37242.1 copper resistance protein [Frankia sp. ACN1ag]KQM05457.1 hypothetical protein FF86_10153 [Frankia sp. CpI1-P]
MRRLTLLIAAALAAIVLTACGNDGSNGSTSTGAADHNAADVTFAQNMIPHHRQAIDMADLAETRASHPEVKTLARQIRAAQAPEIATMVGWLNAWKQPTVPPGGDSGSGHGMGDHGSTTMMPGGTMTGMMPGGPMAGMMSDDDMARLKMGTGPAFDKMFLTMMIAHHRGAITMAKTETRDGLYTPAKRLAENIQNTQNTQITTMQTLLTKV